MEITIYTTPNCKYCTELKDYLASQNIDYTVKDVSRNLEERSKMIQLSGQMGVPVMHVGQDVLVGFDKAKVDEVIYANELYPART